MRLTLPVENERGERLVAVHAPPAAEDAAAMAARVCLVIAATPDGVLLVLNTTRGVWELPGGFVDGDEPLARCAARELHEETGCEAYGLSLVALLDIEPPGAAGTLRAALFSCTVADVPPFVPGAEIAALRTWRPGEAVAELSAVDAALLNGVAFAARPNGRG